MSAYDLAFFCTPHFPNFPDPILFPEFVSGYRACDVFLLEWAVGAWEKYEPELELSFNKLSRGEVRSVMSRFAVRIEGELPPFDRELQKLIFGKNKRIVLERTKAEYVSVSEGDIMNLAASGRMDEAVALYKSRLEQLAENIVKRDNELVETLKEEQGKGEKLLVFRGADHERHLRSLFERKAQWVIYGRPPLLGRLIGCLTMGEQVDDLDVERVIYAMTHRKTNDYTEFLRLQKAVESMSEEQLQAGFHL